jgi:hypothetical protein
MRVCPSSMTSPARSEIHCPEGFDSSLISCELNLLALRLITNDKYGTICEYFSQTAWDACCAVCRP